MKAIKGIGVLTLGLALTAGCSGNAKKTEAAETAPAIDTTAMDTSVRPNDDFYKYVNGNWMKNNPLKPEYGVYGTFNVLRDSSQHQAFAILQGFSSEGDSDQAKAKLLYDMAMDSVKLNEQGATPILPELAQIDSIQSKTDLVNFLAKTGNYGNSYLFFVGVSADQKDSKNNILGLYQAGLIMGDQDYYKPDTAYTTIQAAYKEYLAKLFTLTGQEEASAKAMASTVFETEKSLSSILYTKLQLRDADLNYNKVDTATFFKTSAFPWREYFAKRNGLNGTFGTLDVSQKGFFDKLNNWIDSTPLESIKALLKASTIDDAASLLSDDFCTASFNFHGKVMSGKEEMEPRWKKAVGMVDACFGEVVGKEYAAKYFPQEAKDRMMKLVSNLNSALSERINSLTWMSEETKKKAQEKLSSFKVKIGFPNKWKSYQEVEKNTNSLYDYVMNIRLFETNDNIADLNKPVDNEKWLMNAHTVNAYYNPTTNEICFPAGILQPPFFNLHADDAVNYGAIGVVIGHEMTHGFDDQGRKFDKDGNMVNWWTDEDAKQFVASSTKLADQYSKIIVADDVHANGNLTLGENIADQGGLLVAFQAMKKAIGDNTETIDGFTPAQRFFIAYGRLWGENIRKETILQHTKLDPHSLGEWRVNQALKNIPAFYEAFDIKEGDPMYLAPEERVLVW